MPDELIHKKCNNLMCQLYLKDTDSGDKDENYKIYENGYYCKFCKISVHVSNDIQYDLKDVQKERYLDYYSQPPKFKNDEIK